MKSCRPPVSHTSLKNQSVKGCQPKNFNNLRGKPTERCDNVSSGANVITSSAHNLDLQTLCDELGRFGPLDKQPCYLYVIETVVPDATGELMQTASAPNFDGGFITLCTCKRSMRALLTPEEWEAGVWIAGMTGSGQKFNYQQSLVFLMRVGEAYSSQYALHHALTASGRNATVAKKASTQHAKGDLLIPRDSHLTQEQQFSPDWYYPPQLPHAHRATEDDTHWHKDADHVDRWGRRPAYLVGDPAYSFTWSRQRILNSKPGNLRPHRSLSLEQLVSNLTSAF